MVEERQGTRAMGWSELFTPARAQELERAGLRSLCREIGPARAREPVLYVRGSLPTEPAVAVVGTRQPTAEAVELTELLVAGLAHAGLCIVSGGALGIDGAAHTEALRCGARTVVVAGCGLDVCYPPEHAALYTEVVASGGGLVSLWPDGTQPMRHRFLQRNQLLAALSVALLVVQAPVRSGALSAAAAARRQGRLVGAVPHAPWDERGAGCAAELVRGARPVLRAADLIAAMNGPLGARLMSLPLAAEKKSSPLAPGPKSSSSVPVAAHGRRAPVGARPNVPLSNEESCIINVLGRIPMHQDDICARAGLPFAQMVATLLTLTLRTVVVEGPAAYYRLA